MHFELRFPNGDKIPFETLNAEAANLWGVGIARDSVEYVFPPNPDSTTEYDEEVSWVELIGSAIMHPQLVGVTPMQQNWIGVKETMVNSHLDSADVWDKNADEMVRIITSAINWLKPYLALIDHWQSKGYNPIKVK
jgi:hypothetical protein